MSRNPTAQKSIESHKKHEELIDKAVKLGEGAGLDVNATLGNDPKGDVRVAARDKDAFLKLLGDTIDSNRKKRNG